MTYFAKIFLFCTYSNEELTEVENTILEVLGEARVLASGQQEEGWCRLFVQAIGRRTGITRESDRRRAMCESFWDEEIPEAVNGCL